MADLEPAQYGVYGVPETDANVESDEFRRLHEALARNFYTTDDTYPLDSRGGQFRVLADDLANIKIQVYLSGVWKTFVQNVGSGVAAPIKQVVQFGTAAASWVINHNLGSQVVAQVFDASFAQLQPYNVAESKEDGLNLVSLPRLQNILGTGPLLTGLPVFRNGVFLSTFAVVTDDITGSPDLLIDFAVDKTPSGGALVPVTGGVITINAIASKGSIISGSPVTGTNAFSRFASGPDKLNVNVASWVSAPTAGAIDIWANVVRTLGRGDYALSHPTENRIVVDHPEPRTGFVILVG